MAVGQHKQSEDMQVSAARTPSALPGAELRGLGYADP